MSASGASIFVTEPYLSGMGGIMLANEEEAGRKVIWPEHKRRPAWFIPSDWASWPVLSYDDRELHIVAVSSAQRGALTRLIDGAAKAGLSPVVVEPIGRVMPALMEKWGWQMTVVGEGWDRREEWRPASVDTLPKGGDAKQGSVRSKGSAVGSVADETSLSPSNPSRNPPPTDGDR